MTTKKLFAIGSSFIGGLLLFFAFAFISSPSASAATKAWDGGGSDNNMTTDENWVGDSAPEEGDTLVFSGSDEKRTIINDYPDDTSFQSISVLGTSSSSSQMNISGNRLVLADGIQHDTNGTAFSFVISAPVVFSDDVILVATDNIQLTGVVSGSGDISKSGTSYLNLSNTSNSFSGDLVVTEGYVTTRNGGLGSAAGSTTINGSSSYVFYTMTTAPVTIDEPFILTNTQASTGSIQVSWSGCSISSSTYCTEDFTATFSGAIALGENSTFSSEGRITLTGALTGSFTMQLDGNTNGYLNVNAASNSSATPNGTYRSPVNGSTIAATSNFPNSLLYARYNNTTTLLGVRGEAIVFEMGTLKGTGTTGTLTVLTGGTLAPGTSPGCLTSGNLTLAGNFQVELGGTDACTGYDQQIVNGTVDLTGGTLQLSLFNGYMPAANGQQYMIINNDGSDAVTGNFNGLPEGATFSQDGVVYKISYAGGDGNDVVLTVMSTPGAPNTGFGLIKNNPLAIAALTTIAAVAIVTLAKKYNTAKAKTRA